MNTLLLFEPFINEPNPEHWNKFPELMWDLGFEMDCYSSTPNFECKNFYQKSDKEQQDLIISILMPLDTQIVGNHIFSRYRELTHWSDYGYPEEKGAYYFNQAFIILAEKLSKDWEKRNTIPSLEEFTSIVANNINMIKYNVNADFAYSEEGQYHIKNKYDEFLELYKQDKLKAPMFYGKCATETVFILKEM